MTGKKRQSQQSTTTFFTFILSMTLAPVFMLFMGSLQIAHAQEGEMQSSADSADCELEPIVAPTLPEKIPGYTELDPDTQLHVTGRAQVIELESYRLEITGKVKQELSLAYDDLRCMPKTEASPTLICPGFFQDKATWAGVPLKDVLELVGLQEGAKKLKLISADGYSATVSVEEALSGENFLAYEWEGKPIPILHGFPLRAIFPNMQGNRWVKWIVKIEVQ